MKLAAKLVEVMAAVDHVEKRGKNEKQNYTYVKATDVAREVRQALIKNKVIMLASVVGEERWTQPTQSGGTMNYVNLAVDYTFHDGESDETLGPIRGTGWGQDTGDKAPYKAMTGALKYALRTTFLIPDESDPENEAKAPETKYVPEQAHPRQGPAGRSPMVITESQAKRMFAIANQFGWKQDQVKEVVNMLGFEKSADITRDKYEAICTYLEQHSPLKTQEALT